MWQVTLERRLHKTSRGRKISRLNFRGSTAQACSFPTKHMLNKLAVTKHPSTWARLHTQQSGTEVGPHHLQWFRLITWAWMSMHAPPSQGRGCHLPHSQGSLWLISHPLLCLPRCSTLMSTALEHTTLARDLTIGLSIMPRRKIRSSSAAPVALGRDPRLSRTCCMAGGKEQMVRHTGAS